MADRKVVVELIIDDKGTVRVFDQVGKQALEAATGVEDLGRRSETAFSGMVANAGKLIAAVGGITLAYRGMRAAADEVFAQINLADHINDLSQAYGVATTQLSAYRLAAEASGTSLDGLAVGFRGLSRSIVEGDKTLAALLGTSREALKFRDLNDVFLDTAEALSKLPDGAQKAAAANAIFGRSGSELIVMLNEGRTGLQDWTREAERFGLIISQETATAADQFNDELLKMRNAIGGVAMAVGSELMKELTPLIKDTLNWAAANREVIASDVVGFVRGTADAIRTYAGDFKSFSDMLERWSHVAKGAAIGGTMGAVAGGWGFIPGAIIGGTTGYYGDAAQDWWNTPEATGGGISPMSAHGGADPLDIAMQQWLDNRGKKKPKPGGLPNLFGGNGKGGSSTDSATQQAEIDIAKIYGEQVKLIEQRIRFGEEDLKIANDRGASQSSMLEMARGIDDMERQKLEMMQESLSLQLLQQEGLLNIFDTNKGNEQAATATAIALDAVNEALARGPDHARKLADEFANVKQSADDIAHTISDGIMGSLETLRRGGGPLEALDGFFDGFLDNALNTFGQQLPNILQTGMQKISGLFRNSPVGDVSGVMPPDGFIGPPEPSAAPAAGGNPNGAMAGAASFGILLGIMATSDALQAGVAAAKRGEDAAGGAIGAFGNTATLGILPSSVGESLVKSGKGRAFINSSLGLFGAIDVVKMLDSLGPSKKEWNRGQVRELFEESGLDRSVLKEDDDRLRRFVGDKRIAVDPRTGLPVDEATWRQGGHGKVDHRWTNPFDVTAVQDYGALTFSDAGGRDPSTGFINLTHAAYDSADSFRALGLLGGFLSPQQQQQFVQGTVGRASALGLNANQIRYEQQRLIKTMGASPDEAINALNQNLLTEDDHKITQDAYNSALRDTLDLFREQLPNGVDAYALALKHLATGPMGTAVDLLEYNKALEETVRLAGGLQDSLTGGVGGGISSTFQSYLGGKYDPSQLRAGLNASVVGGVTDLATGQLVNSITNNPAFKSWNADIFGAVQSGDSVAFAAAMARTPDIIDLMSKGVTDLLPIFKQLQKVVDDAVHSDPQMYWDQAKGVQTSQDAYNFGLLNPTRKKQTALGTAGRFKTAAEAALADGIVSQSEIDSLAPLYDLSLNQLGSVNQTKQIQGTTNSVFDLMKLVAETAGDTVSYRNIRADYITVDKIISREGGSGTTEVHHHYHDRDTANPDAADQRNFHQSMDRYSRTPAAQRHLARAVGGPRRG